MTAFEPSLFAASPSRLGRADIERPAADSLTRPQILERILELNPSATVEFLGTFCDDAIRAYLDHLSFAQLPRGHRGGWRRPGDTPAISFVEPVD